MSGSGSHRSENRPLVFINYLNTEKELIFKYEDYEIVSQADSAYIWVKHGAFGFDILDEFSVN